MTAGAALAIPLPYGVGRGPTLHIPDGFLSLPVALAFWAVTLLFLAVAVRRTQRAVGDRLVPLMGVMAAFIFAAQMINFPVPGGTSGHLLGGALAAITLGPWPAMLVMASVVGVQALLFQDGGLVVMGANIFNMGLITVLLAYGPYQAVAGRSPRLRLAVAGAAAWLSVMAGALLTALQLWLSGTSILHLVVPAMLGVHALIGIGEALITVAALGFIAQTQPHLVETGPVRGGRGWIVAAVLIALGVVVLAPWASADPDGLQRVAQDLGFLDQAAQPPLPILPNYQVPILGEGGPSVVVAGAIGVLAVAGVATLLARLVRRATGPA